jgi:hypothetical protein
MNFLRKKQKNKLQATREPTSGDEPLLGQTVLNFNKKIDKKVKEYLSEANKSIDGSRIILNKKDLSVRQEIREHLAYRYKIGTTVDDTNLCILYMHDICNMRVDIKI